MTLEVFQRIATEFPKAGLIFLQGRGEPLLNKNLFDMIELAKKSGRRVGLTTNGMALDSACLDRLVDLELDILGISLAGTGPESHNRLRAGTDFDQITASLLSLKDKKALEKCPFPSVHLAYVMLRSNFEDVKGIIGYADHVGSNNIVCSNLAFIPTAELETEAIFLDHSNKTYYENTLRELQTSAKRQNINLHYYGVSPGAPLPVCPENVLKSCYISHDGLVSSCVFTNIPVTEPPGPHEEEGKRKHFPTSVIYGDITQQSLSDIWESNSYKGFRKAWEFRREHIKNALYLAADSLQYPMSQKGEPDSGDARLLEVLPDHCKNCYKILGV
jgi:MoaA/NifB/PqqE/SkfB family radical SAM enzyme